MDAISQNSGGFIEREALSPELETSADWLGSQDRWRYPHHSQLGKPPGRIGEFEITGSRSKLVVATVDLVNVSSVPKQLMALMCR